MAAVQVEFYPSQAFGKARCILSLVEHPTLGQHQNHLLFLVRHRVADRFAARSQYIVDLDPRAAILKVPFKLDLGEYRVLYCLDNN